MRVFKHLRDQVRGTYLALGEVMSNNDAPMFTVRPSPGGKRTLEVAFSKQFLERIVRDALPALRGWCLMLDFVDVPEDPGSYLHMRVTPTDGDDIPAARISPEALVRGLGVCLERAPRQFTAILDGRADMFGAALVIQYALWDEEVYV